MAIVLIEVESNPGDPRKPFTLTRGATKRSANTVHAHMGDHIVWIADGFGFEVDFGRQVAFKGWGQTGKKSAVRVGKIDGSRRDQWLLIDRVKSGFKTLPVTLKYSIKAQGKILDPQIIIDN